MIICVEQQDWQQIIETCNQAQEFEPKIAVLESSITEILALRQALSTLIEQMNSMSNSQPQQEEGSCNLALKLAELESKIASFEATLNQLVAQ